MLLVPKAGLEPARISTVDFESTASTDFATSARSSTLRKTWWIIPWCGLGATPIRRMALRALKKSPLSGRYRWMAEKSDKKTGVPQARPFGGKDDLAPFQQQHDADKQEQRTRQQSAQHRRNVVHQTERAEDLIQHVEHKAKADADDDTHTSRHAA